MTVANSLITAAQGYASTLVSQAQSAAQAAQHAIESVGYSLPGYAGTSLPEPPDIDLDTTPPELDQLSLDLPKPPTEVPAFQDIPDIDASYLPTLGVSAPVLDPATKPSALADFRDVAPTVNTNFTFPTAPGTLTMPTEPTLGTYTTPTKPAIVLPSFDGVKPVDTTTAPTNLDATFAAAYNSMAPQMVAAVNGYVDSMLAKFNPQFATQMAAIEAQLTKYLQGGTGLNPVVEDAIYERARSKNAAEANRARSTAYDDAAARGFTLPNGALMAAIQASRQGAADNNAVAAREIVVMQAEYEQKNLQFAVTQSANLRTALLNTTMTYMQNLTSLNGQALDYAKSVLNAVIETYNTAVKVFGLKLDAYKADAQVYEVKMRGAMAAIELYKAEISALEALVNVDRAKVDIYKARIEAMSAFVGLYKTQVDAVLAQASLEKMKLEIFQIKVQAYAAQVQAKNAEWQGYVASLEGELAKVKAYSAQVEAYNAEINGYKAKIEAKAEAIKARALSNQAKATKYEATIKGYSAVVMATSEVARIKLAQESAKVEAFKAETSAAVAKYQVRSEYYKSAALVGIENSRLSLQAQVQGAENLRNYGAALASISTGLSGVYGQLAGSAMAGMNSLAAEVATSSS